MNDNFNGAAVILIIALGMYIGRLYERRSGIGKVLKDRELDDAINRTKDSLNNMSDVDIIKSIGKYGSVKKNYPDEPSDS